MWMFFDQPKHGPNDALAFVCHHARCSKPDSGFPGAIKAFPPQASISASLFLALFLGIKLHFHLSIAIFLFFLPLVLRLNFYT